MFYPTLSSVSLWFFPPGIVQEHERDVGRDGRVPARGVQGLLHHLSQRRGQDRGHGQEDQARHDPPR